MAVKKFSQLDTAPELSELSFLVGVSPTGGGLYKTYKYTPQQVVNLALAATRQVVNIISDGEEFAIDWAADKEVQIILADGQAYIRDVHFTQDGDTITGTKISFYAGQKLILML